MSKVIRIGTAPDEMALWQAETVAKQLEYLEHKTKVVIINTLDKNSTKKPVYKTGDVYVYTRYLDTALLNNQIDIAIYALKDVPPSLPEGIVQAAVLKRGNFNDVLILKEDEEFFTHKTANIAVSSIRCKSQWLHRFPNHQMIDIEGDVRTRLKALDDLNWDAAVFTQTELKKLDLLPEDHLRLDWMLPAAGQGTIMISTLKESEALIEICKELNHKETEICTGIERAFLDSLGADQNSPVGALATIKNEKLKFKGAVFSPDGRSRIEFTKMTPVEELDDLGNFAARYIIDRNGEKIMRERMKADKDIKVFSTKALSLTQTKILSSHIQVDMDDFVRIRYTRVKPSVFNRTIENVLFTSPDAVTAILSNFSPAEFDFKHIYCAGRKTKRLIEKHIAKVTHFESTPEKLSEYLTSNIKPEVITYFTGNNEGTEIIKKLESSGLKVKEIECYRTVLNSKKIDPIYKGVLFFSTRAIESFLKEGNQDTTKFSSIEELE
ncbi:MAG: hydroxymethylbilane synthase, partial [Flavobacteriia bacterium]